LIQKVGEIPSPIFDVEVEVDDVAYDHDDSEFFIIKDKKSFVIQGGKIERLVSVTDMRNQEAVYRLQNILKSMGVDKALKLHGIKEGDIVKILDYEFEYYDYYDSEQD